METTKQTLLADAVKVFCELKASKLNASALEKVNIDLQRISKAFGINDIQAILVILTHGLFIEERLVGKSRIAKYLDIQPIELVLYQDDFSQLYKLGILFEDRNHINVIRNTIFEYQICLTQQAIDTLEKDLPFIPIIEEEQKYTLATLMDQIQTEFIENEFNNLQNELVKLTKLLDIAKKDIPLIEELRQMGLSTSDIILFFWLARQKYIENGGVALNEIAEKFKKKSSIVAFINQFINEEQILIEKELAELDMGWANEQKLTLTDNALAFLEERGLKFLQKLNKPKGLTEPTEIGEKTLFYNARERNEMDRLLKLLELENFARITSAMKERNMPQGFSILLYGGPGTGKTESVYQLARATGRQIMHVDISESKSMWFGESEKKIKKIFNNYNLWTKNMDIKPILLFNEADAIFSTRQSMRQGGNRQQTENVMQNILLEEMEKLNGILIATTNFSANLDMAFERRFLYKISFEAPEVTVRSRIWQSRLVGYQEQDYQLLAKSYELSGGQIENIVLKHDIYQLLEGYKPDIEELLDYCNQELIGKNRQSVGFR